MDIPEGARRPEDHLPPADPAQLDDAELLADLPELKAPHKLRIRERNRVMKIAWKMRSLLPEESAEGEVVDLDIDNMDDEQFAKLLEAMADVDDFAESIALDPVAYIAWAENAQYEHMSALLDRYSSAVGESTSSSS